MSVDPIPPPGVDPSRPSAARIYDYVLGGKDNYEVDRMVANWFFEVAPDTPLSARANRAFAKRAVRFMAEQGIRQFIDLGSGIPTTPPSVHEAVRVVDASARVVYVDMDPMVVAHSRALRSVESGLATILADVRRPEAVLDHPDIHELIDFDEPVGLGMFALTHMMPDSDDPVGMVRAFRARIAPGSCLGISQFSTGSHPEAIRAVETIAKTTGGDPMIFRSDEEILRFLDGFELVEPGLVDVRNWRPEEEAPPFRLKLVGGVGRLV